MHFPSPGVSKLAGVTVALALLTIAAGAVLTSEFALAAPAADAARAGRIHEYLGFAVTGLAVVLLVWLMPTNSRDWLRGLAWAAVAVAAGEGVVSLFRVNAPLSEVQSLTHAILAPVMVALLAALGCFTIPEWQTDPEEIAASPLLVRTAKGAPALVLLQIALGAAYRHKELGALPHVAVAMLVALAMLVVPVMLLQQFPRHPSLRLLAIAAMSIVLTQITLGISALVMRLLDFDTSAGFIGLAATHAAGGSLTLAAAFVMAIEITRCQRG